MATNDKEVPAEEHRIFWWRPAAWLRVTGDDTLSFLQGQFSNDLRALGNEGAVYGLWLDHKGHVLADSFVSRGDCGEVWIGSYHSSGAAIRERLEEFIIADDVQVEDVTAAWSGVTLFGDVEAGAAPAPADAGKIFAGRRAGVPTREWVFPAARAESVRAHLAGATELKADAMERERILAGIPAIPADIGPGELPHEGGLEGAAISYEKGCYVGQEVMARLKSMGRIRRRLTRVRGVGEIPVLPAALFQGDRKVGELRSAASSDGGFVGLALISLVALQPSQPLGFSSGARGTIALDETP